MAAFLRWLEQNEFPQRKLRDRLNPIEFYDASNISLLALAASFFAFAFMFFQHALSCKMSLFFFYSGRSVKTDGQLLPGALLLPYCATVGFFVFYYLSILLHHFGQQVLLI